jgi:D-tyrosyl-tRNA(Tyr) deacylase
MISLIQRVLHARVVVDHQIIGQIEKGLLVLVCAERGDDQSIANKLLDKILKLRIFSDDQGKMNLSVQDVGGGMLIVSQFTLAADCSGGIRPSFGQAAPPELGKSLYESFLACAKQKHPNVQSGQFGANMQVHLINDGPVTIPLRIQS